MYAGLILIILIGTFGILKYYIIFKKGVYVVGRIDRVTVGRSGAMVYIHYNYNGKKYSGGFKPGFSYDNKIGRRIFVKILSNYPSNFDYTDVTVPDYVLKSKSELEWNQIPNCP